MSRMLTTPHMNNPIDVASLRTMGPQSHQPRHQSIEAEGDGFGQAVPAALASHPVDLHDPVFAPTVQSAREAQGASRSFTSHACWQALEAHPEPARPIDFERSIFAVPAADARVVASAGDFAPGGAQSVQALMGQWEALRANSRLGDPFKLRSRVLSDSPGQDRPSDAQASPRAGARGHRPS